MPRLVIWDAIVPMVTSLYWYAFSIDSGNYLVPNRRQVVTWTIVELSTSCFFPVSFFLVTHLPMLSTSAQPSAIHPNFHRVSFFPVPLFLLFFSCFFSPVTFYHRIVTIFPVTFYPVTFLQDKIVTFFLFLFLHPHFFPLHFFLLPFFLLLSFRALCRRRPSQKPLLDRDVAIQEFGCFADDADALFMKYHKHIRVR